nr:YqaA family protein [Falsirhodobacter deserti]
MWEMLGLFGAAFLAATLLPAQSEALLFALLRTGETPVWALVSIATLGNVLGSLANWLIGREVNRWKHRHWFPVTDRQMRRAEAFYGRWGRWSLLGSWLPIIGDPLTLIAGVLREPLWSFLLLVTLAKGGRYVIVAVLATF